MRVAGMGASRGEGPWWLRWEQGASSQPLAQQMPAQASSRGKDEGGLLGITRRRDGGLPPPSVPPSPSLQPGVLSPSFTPRWSYWDAREAERYCPHSMPGELLDCRWHLSLGCRTGTACPTSFCTPVPSQGNQGHTCSPPGGAEHLRRAWALGLFLCVALLVFLTPSLFPPGCWDVAAVL